MDSERFDALARRLATGGSRRSILKGLGGALGALVLGLQTRPGEARGTCNAAGDTCTWTGQCCLGLVCAPNGTCQDAQGLVNSLGVPGTGGLLGGGSGGSCGGDWANCAVDSDCCAGYACTTGYCSTCAPVGQFCDNFNGLIKCCQGFTCGSDGTCQCHQQGQSCSSPSDCCGTLTCGSDGTCVPGTIGGSCSSNADCGHNLTCCGGTCADTSSDVNNCGSCGRVCGGSVPGAVTICSAGTCAYQCGAGYSLCSSGAGSYCCTKCCPTKGGTVCC